MASNFTKRLDKLEKGIQQLLTRGDTQQTVYLFEHQPAPDEGIEVIRMVWSWVAAPERVAASEGSETRAADKPFDPPPLPAESEAERNKRHADHLKAIAKDRYQGEGPRPVEVWESIA